MRSGTGWWLEDAWPGAIIRHPHGRTIDDAEHVWLAWITNNVSDVHGNAHRPGSETFGRPVVLGALTVAIAIGLAEPGTPPPEAAVPGLGLLHGWQAIRLLGPVFPGDTLRAESHIQSVSASTSPGWGLVSRRIVGQDQRGGVVVDIEEHDRPVPARPR